MSTLSDSDKAKVMTPGSIEVTLADVRAGMDLPSGSRPRIYAYWQGQIVKVASHHYLERYVDAEFYWTSTNSMSDIGAWMVGR